MSNPSPPQSISFWDFLKTYNNLLSWVAKAAIAVPLVDFATKLGPPWPSQAATTLLTSVVVLIVLMLIYEFGTIARGGLSLKKLQILMLGSTSLILFAAIGYFWMVSHYVVIDDYGGREVIGWAFQPDIDEVAKKHPNRTPQEWLSDYHNPEVIWTRESIIVNRLILLLNWLLTWIIFASLTGSFIALRIRRKSSISSPKEDCEKKRPPSRKS